jgi:hypothetical protein
MKNKIIVLLVFINNVLLAQEVTIRGVVSDEFGPIPGATIIVKGTTNGTQTDFDGNYEIKAKIGDTLVISFIGFETQEVKIENKSSVDVELKIDITLEGQTFCCCMPATTITPKFYSALEYKNKGLSIDIENLYILRQSLDVSVGHQTNFNNNYLSTIELSKNYLFYLGSSVNATLKFRDINVSTIDFVYNDYKLIFDSSYKTIYKYYTSFYVGLGLNKLNKNKNLGLEAGFEQYIIPNIAIYSTTTYWKTYWEFKTGIKLNYKRINLFIEHNKINQYYDYNVGLGYRLYL